MSNVSPPEYTPYPKSINEIAHVAAKYWADLLREDVTPSLVRDAAYADRENAVRGLMGDGLIAMIKQGQPSLTPGQCDKFEEELAKLLANGLVRNSYGDKPLSLPGLS